MVSAPDRRELVRYLIGKELSERRLLAIAGMSASAFLGGLRPIATDDGRGIVVQFVKGPFLQLCEKAHQNPNVPHVLFIDESTAPTWQRSSASSSR